MNDQSIELVTVAALRTHSGEPRRFYIPSYQRGYRWTATQVVQLLEDIREFTKRPSPQPEDFYCLQPLVVKARPDGSLEVVDGQQRLTTLGLILRHFNERLTERFRQPEYHLVYETRPGLKAFLTGPTAGAAADNADFHHFFHAIQAIEEWFTRHDTEVEEFKASLLNRTKVIWYQLSDADNPVDAFTRLNVGKIPLTNDELIRALFLRRRGSSQTRVTERQLRIAQEWDQIEKSLQSDAFWYFFNNEKPTSSSRIGVLFELVASERGAKLDRSDRYALFYHFNEELSDPSVDVAEAWTQVKMTFLALEEWFEDRTLFHLVGFLVRDGMSVEGLRALSRQCGKRAFEQRLRVEIFRRALKEPMPTPPSAEAIGVAVDARLAKLSYLYHGPDIRRILLLFNVATLLLDRRSNIRFQFEDYKVQRWDIEHVRSVSKDALGRHDDRKAWLGDCLTYLESADEEAELCGDIRTFLATPRSEAGNDLFDPLYARVLDHFEEADDDTEALHGIGNLTLLDQSTNRSYGNAVFAVKRKSVLRLDQAGIFVPLCTRNVFLKCYSENVGHALRWTEDDQEAYLDEMENTLTKFFLLAVEVAA